VYTEFEQAIFDRSLKNYKNKHGDHPGRSDILYKGYQYTHGETEYAETHKTDMWDEFWGKYLNSEEELL
jgi:hypothetical protein